MGLSVRGCPTKIGDIRSTVNYKRLNAVTTVGKLPLPRIDEVLDSLGKGNIFSTFGLSSGFFQSAVHPGSVPLTAFCTSSGLYEWLRIPKATASALGFFQRLMQRMTEGLRQ